MKSKASNYFTLNVADTCSSRTAYKIVCYWKTRKPS